MKPLSLTPIITNSPTLEGSIAPLINPATPNTGAMPTATPESVLLHTSVLADLSMYGVEFVEVLKSSRRTATKFDQLDSNRPYIVLKTFSKVQNSHFVYKARLTEDFRSSALNELFFLKHVAPHLKSRLPKHLLDKIRFPKYIKGHHKQPSFLMEYIEGKRLGGIHVFDLKVLKEQDLYILADAIKSIHKLTPGELKNIAPKIKLWPSIEEQYHLHLSARLKMVQKTLGKKYSLRLLSQLISNQNFVNLGKDLFAIIDIQPSNIIKSNNGQLCLVDWDRISVSKNPAVNYGFILTDLWVDPALQQKYFDYVLKINRSVKNFKEYLRLDFIFNRGIGELAYWAEELQAAPKASEKEQAALAVTRLSELLKQAINQIGMWA